MENNGINAVRRLEDVLTTGGAELLKLHGVAAVVLPIKGGVVAIGSLGAIAKVLPKDEGATAQPVAASAAGLEGLTAGRIIEIANAEIVAEYDTRDAIDFARAIEREVLATQSAKQGAQADLVQAAHRLRDAAYNFNASKFVLGSKEHQAAAHEFQAAQDNIVRIAISTQVAQESAHVAEVRDQAPGELK